MRRSVLITMLFLLISMNPSFAMGENRKKFDIIKEKFKMVDLSDGVNKEEASIIAQNHLVNKNFQAKDINIFRPRVEQSGLFNNFWVVIFNPSFHIRISQGLEWYSLNIDKQTGEIKTEGWGPS